MKSYIFIIIPLISVALAQVLKFIYEAIIYKKINILRLLDGSGGMPSSHSTLVSSLVTILIIKLGLDNPITAVSIVFGVIVLYDAMGIRYEAGKQAEIINKLVEKSKLFDAKTEMRKLKEKVGHKPIEVLCGILLGIFLSIVLSNILI